MGDDLGGWNPMAHDYNNPSFNSYDSGPARGIGAPKRGSRASGGGDNDEMELYVNGIPNQLTEDGLKQLFEQQVKDGKVTRLKKMASKLGHRDDTFGFVTFSHRRHALEAIEKLDRHKLCDGKFILGVKASKPRQQQEPAVSLRSLAQADTGDNEFDNDEDNDAAPERPKGAGGDSAAAAKAMTIVSPALMGRGQRFLTDRNEPPRAPGGRGVPPVAQSTPDQSFQNVGAVAPGGAAPPPSGAVSPAGSVMGLNKACATCGKSGANLSRQLMACKKCRTNYCDAQCQKQDWPKHKKVCKELQTKLESQPEVAEQPQVSGPPQSTASSRPPPQQQSRPVPPPLLSVNTRPPPQQQSRSAAQQSRPSPAQLPSTLENFATNFEIDVPEVADVMAGGSQQTEDIRIVVRREQVPPAGAPSQPVQTASAPSSKPPPAAQPQPLAAPSAAPAPLQVSPPISCRRKLDDMPNAELLRGKASLVHVQYVTSPDDMYLILAESLPQLNAMQMQLKEEYTNTTNLGPKSYVPEKDEICAAQSEVDGDWYRATVKAISLDAKASVRFIDYGNTEEIPVTKTRKIKHEFLQLPAQAMKARLPLVSTDPGGEWSRDAIAALVEFGFPDCTTQFECLPKGRKGGVYKVSMETVVNGKKCNVADELVARGLAKPEVVPAAAVKTPPAPAAAQGHSPRAKQQQQQQQQQQPKAHTTPPKAASPRSQQQQQPKTHTTPPKPASPRQPQAAAAQAAVQPEAAAQTNVYAPGVALPPATAMATPPALPPAPPPAAAAIVPPPPPIPMKCGNYPTMQKEMELQAVYTVRVVEFVSGDLFWVHLVKPELQELDSLQEAMNQHYSTKPVPKESSFTPKAHNLFACKFTADNNWYRAHVYYYDAKALQVFYLDYGNREYAKFDQVIPLEGNHLTLPFQAVCCRLAGVTGTLADGGWSPEAMQFIMSKVAKEVQARVVAIDDGQVAVKLKVEGGVLHKQLIDNNLAKEDPTTSVSPPQPTAPTPQPPVTQQPAQPAQPEQPAQPAIGETNQPNVPMVSSLPRIMIPSVPVIPVFCPDAPDHKNITVQLLTQDSHAILEDVMTRCRDLYSTCRGDFRPSVLHSLVVAQFPEDLSWYRAEVIGLPDPSNQQQVTVRFVDYGNVCSVPLSAVAQIHPSLLQQPRLGIRCTLAGVGELNEGMNWSRTIMEQKSFALHVVEDKGDIVDGLFINTETEEDISTTLISSGVLTAALSDSQLGDQSAPVDGQSGIPELPVAATNNCTIVHFNGPWEFYIQLLEEQKTSQLQQLLVDINKQYGGSTPDPTSPTAKGEFVAVFYEADDCWYRCQVLSVSGRKVKVDFVDFGNHDVVDIAMVRKLDPKYLQYPRFALRCALGGLTESSCRWSAAAVATMEKLVNNNKLIVYIDTAKHVAGSPHHVTEITLEVEGRLVKLTEHLVQSGCLRREQLVHTQPTNTSYVPSPARPQQQQTAAPTAPAQPSQAAPRQAASPPKPAAAVSPEASRPAPTAQQQPPAASSGQKTPPKQHLPQTQIETLITHVLTPDEFYLNIKEDWAYHALEQMLVRLNQSCRSMSQQGYEPSTGELVAACYETVWYRGLVTVDTADRKFHVYFIDFGNTEALTAEDIRKLPSEFYSLPQQAILCRLHGVEPPRGARDWKPRAKQMMEAFNAETQTQRLIYIAGPDATGAHSVDLLNAQTKTKLSEKLINDECAAAAQTTAPSQQQQPPVRAPARAPVAAPARPPSTQPINISTTSPSTAAAVPRAALVSPPAPQRVPPPPPAFTRSQLGEEALPEEGNAQVVEAAGLEEVYLQAVTQGLTQLAPMEQELNKYCMATPASPNYRPQVGELCCAQFSGDDVWYRAVVTSVSENGGTTGVFMLDWGSSDTVSNSRLRPFLDGFLLPPPQAFKCKLHGVKDGVADKALARLKELTIGQMVTCRVVERSADGCLSVVQLVSCDGVDVNQQVAALVTQPEPESETERLRRELEETKRMLAQLMAERK